MLDLSKVRELATARGWQEIDYQSNIFMVSFKRQDQRINVYLTKATVGTAIKHPKKGKTQLFRRNVTLKQLEKILDNTRVHTSKGYYKRKGKIK